MRVLVTGASGFIGAHACRVLSRAGCEVGALVRPETQAVRLTLPDDNVTLLQGDVYDTNRMREIVAQWQPEACLHLAWYVETGKCLTSSENLRALNAGLHLTQILSESGCRHLVTAGTCAEYDTERGWLKEDGPTRPETLYAAAKLSLCLTGQQIARRNAMRFAHARIFYVYGPQEDRKRVVPALISSLRAGQPFAATKGEQVRDYLHVQDVASALWTLLRSDVEGAVNIASSIPVPIHSLMDVVGRLMGRPELIQYGAIPYRAWDPHFICGDNTRLLSLGWKPCYSLQEGLQQTVDWWQDNLP